jgi:hypothetical protein
MKASDIWFFALAFYLILFSYGVVGFFTPYDATDDVTAGKRSGMALRIDYGTRCQYLRTHCGTLTPRISGDGKTHYGCNG